MERSYFLAGITAGGMYSLAKFWASVERPILELILLGRIPGTDYVVDFNQALAVLLLIMVVAIYRQHQRHLQIMRFRLIVMTSL